MNYLLLAALIFFISESKAELELLLENATAEIGTNATIPCRYKGLTGFPKIIWSATDTSNERKRLYIFYTNEDQGTSSKDPLVERNLSVDSEGSLVIPNVTLEDDQAFKTLSCEVDFGQPGDKEGSLTFTVVAFPPILPVASFDPAGVSSFDPTDEPRFFGQCRSGPGYPRPKIALFKDGKKLDNAIDDGNSMENTDDPLQIDVIYTKLENGTFVATQNLFSTISVDDDKAVFTCEVTTGEGSDTNKQKAMFPVFRVNHPTDRVVIKQLTPHAIRGEMYTLKCEANGYPVPKIVFDNQENDELNIMISDADIGRSVQCTAGNATTSFQIQVRYVNKPTITGKTTLNLDEKLSLTCDAKASPPVEKLFMKRDDALVKNVVFVGYHPVTYEVENARFNDAGAYTCMVENGFPSLKQTSDVTEVTVQGLILDAESVSVKGEVMEVVKLSCMVTAKPKPSFEWRKPDNSTITNVKTDHKPDSFEYTSTIDVSLEYTISLQQYRCEVTNDAGTKIKTFTFPELLQQAGPPVAAIVIVILAVLLTIIIVAVVLYRKGYFRKKAYKQGEEVAEDISMEMNEKDAEKGPDEPENGAAEQQGEKEPEEEQNLVKKNGEKDR